jgi:hypothetical protein
MKSLKLQLALWAFCALLPSVSSAQWVQTNGPYGGSVITFAVSGTNLFSENLNS